MSRKGDVVDVGEVIKNISPSIKLSPLRHVGQPNSETQVSVISEFPSNTYDLRWRSCPISVHMHIF